MLNRLRRARLLRCCRRLPLVPVRIAVPAGRLAAALGLAPVQTRRQVVPVLAAALFGGAILPVLAADPPKTRAPRPPDLVILLRSESVNGQKQVGIFGVKADPQRPGLWSVQVWEETTDRVTIATDRIRCSATAPMRITGAGSQLLVRELNPGGAIHPANRLDHLIWWAVCHPSLAGRDPAGLAEEARQLGYSGQLPESQQVLQAPRP